MMINILQRTVPKHAKCNKEEIIPAHSYEKDIMVNDCVNDGKYVLPDLRNSLGCTKSV